VPAYQRGAGAARARRAQCVTSRLTRSPDGRR